MRTAFLRLVVVAILLALWEGLPRSGLVNPNFLTPLSGVLESLWQLLRSGQLAHHAAISLQRIAAGLGVSILVGVPLGVGMGWWRPLEDAFDGPLQAGRQISAFALFPVFILFFGIGEVSKVVIVFWASVWPIILNATAGVKGVDPVLVRAARSMNARGWTLLRKVVIPAAAPSIFTGIRLGGSYAFMVLVAAEMIGANAGLGFLVLNSQEVFRIPQMYAAIVALVIFGLALNRLLLGLERSATPWQRAGEA
jgi:NitT/TauT family transport system permease protein